MKNLTLFLLAALILNILISCSSSKGVKKPDSAKKDKSVQADSLKKDEEKKLSPVTSKDLTEEELAQLNKIMDDLKDIPFDFDSYTIPTESMEIIKHNVNVLNEMLKKRGKMIRIVIEGHCDARGSDEYNLALGQRRANTVRTYLLKIGFMEEALKTISYGEEKPKVEGSGIEAWASNRRVHIYVE